MATDSDTAARDAVNALLSFENSKRRDSSSLKPNFYKFEPKQESKYMFPIYSAGNTNILPRHTVKIPSNDQECQKKALITLKNAFPSKKSQYERWTPEEDALLNKGITIHGETNWNSISQIVKTKDKLQCRQRWQKVIRPGIKKGKWSTEEDEELRRLVQYFNSIGVFNWRSISERIPSRTSKQCRERWNHHLCPGITKDSYSPEEDKLLQHLLALYGPKWSKIAKEMPGRTENSVRSRLQSLRFELGLHIDSDYELDQKGGISKYNVPVFSFNPISQEKSAPDAVIKSMKDANQSPFNLSSLSTLNVSNINSDVLSNPATAASDSSAPTKSNAPKSEKTKYSLDNSFCKKRERVEKNDGVKQKKQRESAPLPLTVDAVNELTAPTRVSQQSPAYPYYLDAIKPPCGVPSLTEPLPRLGSASAVVSEPYYLFNTGAYGIQSTQPYAYPLNMSIPMSNVAPCDVTWNYNILTSLSASGTFYPNTWPSLHELQYLGTNPHPNN